MAKSAAQPAKSSSSITALQGLVAGATVMGAPSLFLLLAVLLAPGVLCVMSERSPGHPVARVSLLAGLAFSLAPAWQLWSAGLSLDHAFTLLADAGTLANAWCAGSFAWLVGEMAPIAVGAMIEMQTERRRRRLVEQRVALIKAWNLKIEAEAE